MIDMTSEDINRTYGDTFVGFQRGDTIHAAYVRGSDGRNELALRVYSADGDDVEHITTDINNYQVILSYPDSGVYNISPDRAAYIERKTQRQYRRGITQRHLSIVGDVSFDHRVVHSMFNPKYDSYSRILERIGKHRLASGAISRQFWLRGSSMFENPVIYFRNRPIGEIIEGKAKIKSPVFNQMFKEITREAE